MHNALYLMRLTEKVNMHQRLDLQRGRGLDYHAKI